DEIFEVATNIAVISEGKLSEPHPVGSLSLERIGLMMGGIHESHSIPDAMPSSPEATYAH
ncbi:MAG: ABC transporter ATP-binding protein, partial [Rhizobiaceae bacterium]